MKKEKQILLGNEAIVRGALEAGVDYVSAYPGTPSSEIGNIFGEIAKGLGIYFEFSTNEKVAMESAIGASFSGLKSLVSMKHFGLNVAADSFLPFCYTGTKAPSVLMVADDPSCWSSGQSEQNSRAYAYLAHCPMIEPSDAQEAKDYTKFAFELSEKFNVPVVVRTTTRIAHQRMPVELKPLGVKKAKTGKFEKNVKKFVTMPPRVLEMKDELLEKIEKIRDLAEKSSLNKKEGKKGPVGIITSSVSYLYVKEALDELGLDMPILKLGFFYPLPNKKINDFIKSLKKVLIVEELEGYLEKEVKALAKEANPKLKVFGKDLVPVSRELNTEKVAKAISSVTGKKYKKEKTSELDLPKRYPRLCPGCPYWTTFAVVKKTAPKGTIFGGDIGCYMLAGFPPHEMQDYLFSMGSSIGIGHGIRKASTNRQKLIAFIGDSTFFHAGIPALLNTVYNQSDPLIIIMDNRITAMTGHQPNPGMEKTGMGDPSPKIKIEDIVKACGVKHVKTIDPVDVKEMEKTVKDFVNKKEVSVIVARRMCALLAKKLKKK